MLVELLDEDEILNLITDVEGSNNKTLDVMEERALANESEYRRGLYFLFRLQKQYSPEDMPNMKYAQLDEEDEGIIKRNIGKGLTLTFPVQLCAWERVNGISYDYQVRRNLFKQDDLQSSDGLAGMVIRLKEHKHKLMEEYHGADIGFRFYTIPGTETFPEIVYELAFSIEMNKSLESKGKMMDPRFYDSSNWPKGVRPGYKLWKLTVDNLIVGKRRGFRLSEVKEFEWLASQML